MAKTTKPKQNAPNGGGIVALTRELWQAAVTLRGSIEPADYKRYVLPIIFLRFLSLRYDKRRAELEALVADKNSDYPRVAAGGLTLADIRPLHSVADDGIVVQKGTDGPATRLRARRFRANGESRRSRAKAESRTLRTR
jgi:type I restriction-modification system DNA methylase subunit